LHYFESDSNSVSKLNKYLLIPNIIKLYFGHKLPEFHYPDSRLRKTVTDGVGNNVAVYENGS